MEPPPASASLEKPPMTKKSWQLVACDNCIKAEHDIKHKAICGTEYRGKSVHNCKNKECQRMILGLWHASFLRSKDCPHSNGETLLEEAASVSEPSRRLHNPGDLGPRTSTTSTQPQNKVTKRKYNAARTSLGAFAKRTGQKSSLHMTERISHLGESAIVDRQSPLPELVRKHFSSFNLPKSLYEKPTSFIHLQISLGASSSS